MSKSTQFDVCHASLIKILETVKPNVPPDEAARIDSAMGFAAEMKALFVAEFPARLQAPKAPGTDADSTNYAMYKLLHELGLTPAQLIAVASSDGLPELRILRMLRIVLEIGLPEARLVMTQAH